MERRPSLQVDGVLLDHENETPVVQKKNWIHRPSLPVDSMRLGTQRIFARSTKSLHGSMESISLQLLIG